MNEGIKKITLKDLEDCIREIIFKEENVITDDEYIYDVNNNIIKVKTRRSKKMKIIK